MAGVLQTLDLDQVAAWAEQTGRDLAGLSFERPLKVAKLIIVSDIRENFAGSHGPDGQPWAKLKHRQGLPLRDKGLLLAASTTGLAETNDGHTLTLMNNLDYAAVHQFGATIHMPERKRTADEGPWVFTGRDGSTVFTRRVKEHEVVIPARPFMGVSDGAADRIAQAFAEHVLGVL